jgi:hypothetical protein
MRDADIDRVVHLLGAWSKDRKYGKLTWDRLIARLEQSGRTWTRQALFAKEKVAEAFERAKDEIRGVAPKAARKQSDDSAVALLESKIASQQVEIDSLTRTLRDYDERFIRYQHNAQRRGVTVAELNMPLPESPHGSPSDGRKRKPR